MDFGSSRYADPYGYSDRYRNAYVDANTNADSDSNGHSYRDGYNDASADSYTNYDCECNTDLYSAA